MKKNLVFLMGFLLLGTTFALEGNTLFAPEFKPMSFQANLENNAVYLSWDQFQLPEGHTFGYWKVMRSQTSENPIVETSTDSVLYSNNDIALTKFKDVAPRIGNNWYRVCAITKAADGYHRYCSSEVKKIVLNYYYTGTINPPAPPVPPIPTRPERLAPEFKSMNFQANLENKIVYMSWNPFLLPAGQTFVYWKIMRSQATENPVYNDGKGDYITHSSDINLTLFKDTAPKPGTNRYRICAITKSADGYRRYCSSEVKKIIINSTSNQRPDDDYKNETQRPEDDYKNGTKKPETTIGASLTAEQKTALDALAIEFLKKLDEKYANNPLKKKMVLENVITQLKNLANKQAALKPLVAYLISKLQPTMSTDPMDQLKNILILN